MKQLLYPRRLAHPAWVGYAVALVLVVLADLITGLILSQIQVQNLAMLQIVVVLAVAVSFGSEPAILAALAATLTYDWFFVEPLHSLSVAHPGSWVALLILLVTAVITGQLAAGQQQSLREAEELEREAVLLADIIRLMNGQNFERSLQTVAERLCRELRLLAASIEISDPAHHLRVVSGDAQSLQPESTPASTVVLNSGPVLPESHGGAADTWVRVVPPFRGRAANQGASRRYSVMVRVAGHPVGALELVGRPSEQELGVAESRLLSAVAAQLGLVVEQLRLRRETTEVEVLRRTDALRSSLLNSVSHDLRTPLVSIMAAAGSLLQDDVAWSSEERRQFAESIDREAARLNRLVGNLLDLSRIESGNLRVKKEWHDLDSLVDDVLDRMRPITARHRVVVDLPEELPPVPLDYVQIDQVLTNLVDNSVKYSPEGSEIRVAARLEPGEVRVTVSNRSPAIPAEALKHIFEPFYQAETGGRSGIGMGLGLAVARGLVDAHGGRIRATSGAGGTSFEFALPLGEKAGEGGERDEPG